MTTKAPIPPSSSPYIRQPLLGFSIFILASITFFSLAGIGRAQQNGKPNLTQSSWKPASNQNTLFLPLKIYAASEEQALQKQIDAVYNEVQISKKQVPFPRDKAERHFNYKGAWPPPFTDLAALGNQLHLDYAAVGGVTQLGQKLSIDLIVYNLHDPSASRLFYKEADSLNNLEVTLNEVIGEVLAHTGKYYQIASIKVEGNSRIDSGAILRHAGSMVGDRYSPEQLRKDIKNIYKMGYFKDVQVSTTDSPKGKNIVFKVVEKAVIGKVQLTGNKEIEDKDIREVVTVTPNSIINNQEINKSIANIKKLYKEKGFYNTEVTADVTAPKADRVNVDFKIKEGHKVFIKEISFSGNKNFSDRQLKKVIETSERGIFSWFTDTGVLKKDVVEQDVARIAAFYHNNGFIDAKVGEPEIRQEGKWLYITFNIFEGERYKVGYLKITGDLITEGKKLLAMTTLLKQPYFSRKVLRDDIVTLSDYYAEKGYAFAEITPYVEKDKTGKTVVTVTIDIKKNELVHVNRIIIKGNTRTRDKVIRREIKLKEGDIFNATALKESHERLQRLNFFEDVSITPEQTGVDSLMDIVVDVKEKPTGSFSIGAGYSSVEQFMLMGEISQNNFLGRGQRLSLQANISGISKQYNLQFNEPHLNDSELAFGFDVYNWDHQYDDYTKDSQGFDFKFGYPVWEKWRANWSYGYDNTHLTDINFTNVAQEILDSLDIKVTSYVTLGFSRDTRNRNINPTEGNLQLIESKYAGGPLGGDSYFTKVQGSSSWYFPFYFHTTLHLKGSVGYVTRNSGGKLPVYEKFYLGGINTIRGFKNGQISPIDPKSGDRIGGDKMWYINEEIIFPLVPDAGLNGVVFLDAGNVYDIGENWDFDNIKRSVGLGFRWLSPLGPLRLEWGYNLHPVNDEDHSNWDFSIGGAF
ncbi:MAG: outer membrane protein assembly factor BamA [Deltaproteobacteria bacterium]